MRWIVRLLGVVVSLGLLAGLALFLVPTERIAGIAAERFEAATGRALTIDGPVRAQLYPLVGVRMDGVALANADWAEDGPMLRAEAIDLGLDVAALIAGDIVIRRLEMRAPELALERAADGRANWDFAGTGGAGGGAGTRSITLDLAELSGGTLRFNDSVAGTRIEVSELDAALRMPDPDGELRLTAAGTMAGERVSLDATAGNARALTEGRLTTLVAQAEAGEARLRFDGRAGLDGPSAEGQLDLSIPRLARVQRMLGQTVTDLPAGTEPLALSGQITRTADGTLHARGATFALGPNRLRGAADLRIGGDRPRLTAQLDADTLDVRALAGGGGGGGEAGGWSRTPMAFSALGAVDADVTLTAGAVQTGLAPLGRTRIGMRLDAARAVFDLREVTLHDGRVTGEFVVNGRGNGSVGGTIRARDIALAPLLERAAGFDRLQGTGNLDLQFLGLGTSMHAIMNTLSGEGRLQLDQGAIEGLDLAGMLRTLDMSYMGDGARTIYDRVTGSFTIDGGVLRNDDLRLEASRLSVAGRGTVGLGERVLNYRVTPEAMRDPETGDALRVPVLITGPWDQPRFRLDLEGLAQQRLEDERERLEALARDEARRREQELRQRAEDELQERLGVERREGESLEDTARRALEEGIGRGLGRLLGRD